MTINIVDVNDNSPIITTSSYVAGVKENLPSGQSVLRVRRINFRLMTKSQFATLILSFDAG